MIRSGIRSTFCALSAVILASNFAGAQSQVRRDGNWWLEQSADFKNTYVVGIFDGEELGNNFGHWKIAWSDACHSKIAGSYSFYDSKYFKHVDSLQLSQGLTTFYANFRNRSILTKDAVWPVLREIAGDSQQEIEHLVVNLRKNASNEPFQ